MPRGKALTAIQVMELTALARAGYRAEDISELLGIAPATVRGRLASSGLLNGRSRRGGKVKRHARAIKRVIGAGGSLQAAADETGVSVSSVRLWCIKHGIALQSKRGRPAIANPVRRRQRSGASGQDHYEERDKVYQFNRRLLATTEGI